jgi:hypothetical protein
MSSRCHRRISNPIHTSQNARASVLRRVPGENEIVISGRRVASHAFVLHDLVGFAVGELSESPSAGRGVFLRVLDHELYVRRRAGYKRNDCCGMQASRAMMAPSGNVTASFRYARIAKSFPSLARTSLYGGPKTASEINCQSRYPGGSFTTKDRCRGPIGCVGCRRRSGKSDALNG